MILEIVKGDITEIEADAIVNAANTSLLGGGGVDGAIHRKGGKAILDDCITIRNRQGGCSVGDAVITTAGNLPSKFVIHTVGPVWNNGESKEEELLQSCYVTTLKLAVQKNIKTIAFPNISTGIYKFPKDLAAKIAYDSICKFEQKEHFEKIIFVCFDDENFNLYRNLIEKDNGNKIKSGLFGVAVGDALGVPVEFESRDYLKENPVLDMTGYGTHYQPIGTWSDDSSLTFCLADSLCRGYDLSDIAKKFVSWYSTELWTPHGKVFDIGIATRSAIHNIGKGHLPELCGGFEEKDNGNGSLMRILPLVFYLQQEKDIAVIYKKVKEVSSITHAHFRSVFACFIYVVYCLEILKGKNKGDAYKEMQKTIAAYLKDKKFNVSEIDLFDRVLNNNIAEYPENRILSSGYVVDSLQASLWCFLNSESYEETVLKAVNLGEDTDTTGAIAGGLAGIYYGIENIPRKWVAVLARKKDIDDLCERLSVKLKDAQ
ncbi:O-acetyl-ADP-ribose deacetylase [Flavobacterium sp. Fl-318]|uniref:O-acetyl-ADP-ribose deacetylase n=1 Tax=Flavobacterium cupriresistens TaxID=2893885 RepID=A0ABU4RG23_9FLAO|nr:O-acetyl-ADP-ribose deacetylase [Flavobacterium sp. Fl-318]MDX6191543.1 O-acetyl-ADP-ribose deacetylase [Flavobacterium sp. Fl-318]